MKSIAGYLGTSRPTVYRTLKKWIAEDVYSLKDKPRGSKRKTDLRAMNEVRKLQENPELGEFRVSAALAQLGIYLSPRTCGRILAVNRKLYGLKKPKRGSKEKKEMPFQSGRRHEIWSVDVRYLEHQLPNTGQVYSISILDNHSRALLASAVSTSQDLTAYLSVLYTAVERYGAPETLVSDGAGIFKANQAKRIYRSLGIQRTKWPLSSMSPWSTGWWAAGISFHHLEIKVYGSIIIKIGDRHICSLVFPISSHMYAKSSFPSYHGPPLSPLSSISAL